tara:strand:- start:218 stop:835 length:618 start_codon:yes stop_codon:yes gene_type:complete
MIRIIIVLLLSALLFYSCSEDEIWGCQDIQAINYNPEANTGGNCEYLEIGDLYQGGVIFYLDSTNIHGLLVAKGDLPGEYQWGCYETEVLGADLVNMHSGMQNSLDIINSCNDSLSSAFQTSIIQWEGYDDWYLPSKDELIEIYNSIGNGNEESYISELLGLENDYYWSSSEYSDKYSWYLHFEDGYSYYNDKYETFKVRPIRSF